MKKISFVYLVIIIAFNISVIIAYESTSDNKDSDVKNETTDIEKEVLKILQKSLDIHNDMEKLSEELMKLGDQVVPILLKELTNENLMIIATSMYTLIKMQCEKALPEIVSAYADNINEWELFNINKEIIKFGDKAIPFLAKELETQKLSIRTELIKTIYDINTKKSIETLAEWFDKEASPRNKFFIVQLTFKDDSANQNKYLDYIHSSLVSGDISIRCKAIRASGFVKDTTKLELLIKCLKDEDDYVVGITIQALLRIGIDQGINAIIDILSDEDNNIRLRAYSSLMYVNINELDKDGKVEAVLIESLNDKDKTVRYHCIKALARCENLDLISHLEKSKKNDSDEENRKEAEIAIKRIIQRMKFKHTWYKYENEDDVDEGEFDESDSKIVNDEINKKILDILEKAKEDEFKENILIEEIMRFGSQAIPTLLNQLYNSNSEIVSVSASALEIICGRKALKPCLEAYLKQSNKHHNWELRSLVMSYRDKAISYLVKEYETDDPRIRSEIIDMIGFSGIEKSVEILSGFYMKEESWKNKFRIIMIVYHKDKANQRIYLEYVHNLMNDADLDVRCEAIRTLGEIKDTTKNEILIKWANTGCEEVKSASILTLCKISMKETVEPVIGLLKHKDSKIRSSAAWSLGFISQDDENLKKLVLKSLIIALSDNDQDVKRSCIYSLDNFIELDIIPHLEKISKNDPSEEIRKAAKEAIEEIKHNKQWHDEYYSDEDEENDKKGDDE